MNGYGQCTKADRNVSLRMELGRRMTDPADVARITCGAVVELDAVCTDDVDVYVGGRLHARGQAVVVDGKLAVRVSEILAEAAMSGALQGTALGGRARTE